MFEIMLTIGGVILGALLTAGYECLKERRSVRHVRVLLSQEIDTIIPGLKEVIELLEAFPANEIPQFIKPMTIEEIAQRVEAACHRESFEACRPHLPVLGEDVMGAVFNFYDNCRLQRHMQALGAYGFLSRIKGKKYFLKYVPEGLRLLKEDISLSRNKYPELYELIISIP